MYKKLLAAVLTAALSACLLTGCSAEDLKAYLESLGISWGGSSSSVSTSTGSSSSTSRKTEPDSPKAKADDDHDSAPISPAEPEDPAMTSHILTIPDGISEITQNIVTNSLMHSDASMITTIKLPDSVTAIVPNAFGGFSKLTSINLEHVTTIGGNAFIGTNLAQVNLDSAKMISAGAFTGCPLTSISLPSATSVGSRTFADNPRLTSASMPKVTSLRSEAFMNCSSLQKVYVGQALTTVESQVFAGCSHLKVIYFAGNKNDALDNWGWKPTTYVDFKDWGTTVKPGAEENNKTYLVYNVPSLDLDQAWPKI